MNRTFSTLLVGAFLSFATSSTAATSFEEALPAAPTPLTIDVSADETANPLAVYNYNFGSWRVGRTAYTDLAFRNYGRGYVRIRQIYTYGGSFRSASNCPGHLSGGYQCVIRIYFSPWTRGLQTGQLLIDTVGEDTRVNLSGYGI